MAPKKPKVETAYIPPVSLFSLQFNCSFAEEEAVKTEEVKTEEKKKERLNKFYDNEVVLGVWVI